MTGLRTLEYLVIYIYIQNICVREIVVLSKQNFWWFKAPILNIHNNLIINITLIYKNIFNFTFIYNVIQALTYINNLIRMFVHTHIILAVTLKNDEIP